MDDAQFTEIAAWVAEAGLADRNETTTLTGFCERAVELGLPIALGESHSRLVSVGRYALRGVGRPQDLFTLERDPDADLNER